MEHSPYLSLSLTEQHEFSSSPILSKPALRNSCCLLNRVSTSLKPPTIFFCMLLSFLTVSLNRRTLLEPPWAPWKSSFEVRPSSFLVLSSAFFRSMISLIVIFHNDIFMIKYVNFGHLNVNSGTHEIFSTLERIIEMSRGLRALYRLFWSYNFKLI
jgi:hypothetical protein